MADYPIKTEEYTRHENQVKLVNDVFKGSDTAKEHLRKFQREDNTDFLNRQLDCTIDNFVFRGIDTRKNIIFRKDISLENITNNELLEWCENDIDLNRTSLNEFAKQWLVAKDRDGFAFALVDTPKVDDTIQTKLDEQREMIRPYAVLIERKDLFYWETDNYGNYKVIAFFESYEDREDGIFGFETKQQVKAIFADGRVMIFREDKFYEEYQREVQEITITKLGNNNIPLFYDMAKINIKAMNRESEKSNYVRVASSPFPLVFGSLQGGDDGSVQTMSVNQGLHFTSTQECDFRWAEMSGQNYEIIRTELKELAEQMENISINFATEGSNKTATEVEAEKTEDESKLTNTAQQLEEALNNMLKDFGKMRLNFNVENQTVEVNKDFSSNTLTPEQVAQLQTMRLNGDISYDRLMDELEKGEILATLTEQEREVEKTRLLNEGIGQE